MIEKLSQQRQAISFSPFCFIALCRNKSLNNITNNLCWKKQNPVDMMAIYLRLLFSVTFISVSCHHKHAALQLVIYDGDINT